jgi:hypothetical protein
MRTLRVAALALLLALPALRAAEPDSTLPADEKFLRDHQLASDGPALMAYFRERTLNEDQKARLAELIKKLGDDEFEVREKASADLVKAGRLALPLLKPSMRNRDAEIARRAADCLRQIEKSDDLLLTAVAARVLAVRKPEGVVEVLLAYLPGAPDESVEEAVVAALGSVGLRDGKAHAALVAALKDRETSRRVAAASLVAGGTAEQRKAVRPLLDDTDVRVRFAAARGLLRAGDKAAVPPLIVLVEKGTPELAWQAEDLLFRIAGTETQVPVLGPGSDGATCRRAWEQWWKNKGDKIDLAKINIEEAERGITIICDINGGRGVWECDLKGKELAHISGLSGPIDAQPLPGGRLLIAERHANRITERDRKGEILWEIKTKGDPVTCQRLSNGNTFIATHNELMEVAHDKKPVYSYTPSEYIYAATRLRNGHIIYAHNQQGIVELDAAGKQVRKVPCPHQGDGGGVWLGVELLPSGRFLVAIYGEDKVVEMDTAGKRHWEASVKSPTYPYRLRNGHTLVPSADGHKVVELDRQGKEVWSVASEGGGRPFRVRRY